MSRAHANKKRRNMGVPTRQRWATSIHILIPNPRPRMTIGLVYFRLHRLHGGLRVQPSYNSPSLQQGMLSYRWASKAAIHVKKMYFEKLHEHSIAAAPLYYGLVGAKPKECMDRFSRATSLLRLKSLNAHDGCSLMPALVDTWIAVVVSTETAFILPHNLRVV